MMSAELTEQAVPESSPPATSASTVLEAAEREASTTYTVQAGDTLLGIAMTHDVPMAAIQLENELGASITVRVGEVLEIPAAGEWGQASPFWVVYEVASGETLSAIAAEYGLDLTDLLSVNSALDPDRLSVGQALVLPLRAPAEVLAAANAGATRLAPSATPEPAATPAVVAVAAEAAEEAGETTGEELAAAPLPVSASVPGDMAALAAEIFRLLNEQRAIHGLYPLVWNDTLARAAQRHANDCEARGWCSHTGSDGSTYKERIIREGYEPIRWSECWAWYGSPERAVAMWMDETPPDDPHRRTILSTYLTEVGVGVVPGNGFGYYFIADFGTPPE
ncbi:MAG: CAP domain-containing protein [Anaerolineae bacterium]